MSERINENRDEGISLFKLKGFILLGSMLVELFVKSEGFMEYDRVCYVNLSSVMDVIPCFFDSLQRYE